LIDSGGVSRPRTSPSVLSVEVNFGIQVKCTPGVNGCVQIFVTPGEFPSQTIDAGCLGCYSS